MNKEILRTYVPSILLCDGIGMTVGEIMMSSHDIMTRRQKELSKYLGDVENDYKEYKRKVLYRFTTNNYRKMHHLPMRRKGV